MAFQSKYQSEQLDRLFEAILALDDSEDCYRFFEDICTSGEITALAQRFEVAEMLHRECTYQEIAEKTGASSATISRVKRFLNYGADGYMRILGRLSAEKREE